LGHGACIRKRPGWRVTATWTPLRARRAVLGSAA
jgi:hypothetical protein